MSTKKRQIIFLYTNAKTKKWLKALCKRQPGKMSQSTMVAQMLTKLQKDPEYGISQVKL